MKLIKCSRILVGLFALMAAFYLGMFSARHSWANLVCVLGYVVALAFHLRILFGELRERRKVLGVGKLRWTLTTREDHTHGS